MNQKRRRNPQEFTIDEAQTATLLVTEGGASCVKRKYMQLYIEMCDREALLPAQRVFRTRITTIRGKRIMCPPHLFPPHGKGTWDIRVTGRDAHRIQQRLKPLLTKEFTQKWKRKQKRCPPIIM